MPHALKLAWIALASRCRVWVGEDRVGRVEMSTGRIAALCDVTYRRAQQILDELLGMACLHRETIGTGRHRSRYCLMPDAVEKVPATIRKRRRATSVTPLRGEAHYPPGVKWASPLGCNPLPPVGVSLGGSWEERTEEHIAAADPSPGDLEQQQQRQDPMEAQGRNEKPGRGRDEERGGPPAGSATGRDDRQTGERGRTTNGRRDRDEERGGPPAGSATGRDDRQTGGRGRTTNRRGGERIWAHSAPRGSSRPSPSAADAWSSCSTSASAASSSPTRR